MSSDESDVEETKGGYDDDALEVQRGKSTDRVDAYGIPVPHYCPPRAKHAVWQYIHALVEPVKIGKKKLTHVCLLCAANLQADGGAWTCALVTTSTSSNALGHLGTRHPDHPLAIAAAHDTRERNKRKIETFDQSVTSMGSGKGPGLPSPKQGDIRAAFKSIDTDNLKVAISKWLISHGTG